jgi:hypothetical protein
MPSIPLRHAGDKPEEEAQPLPLGRSLIAVIGVDKYAVREQLPGVLQPDDSLVIFYAGHGATIESKAPDPEGASKMEFRHTGYLIPVKARRQKPSDWLPITRPGLSGASSRRTTGQSVG